MLANIVPLIRDTIVRIISGIIAFPVWLYTQNPLAFNIILGALTLIIFVLIAIYAWKNRREYLRRGLHT